MTLTPADDDAFELGDFIHLRGVAYTTEQDYEVWVSQNPDYGDDTRPPMANFELNYAFDTGGVRKERRVNIDMLAEDMERIGVLMQFAAREALRRKNG